MKKTIGILILCCICFFASPLVLESKVEAASKGNLPNGFTWKLSDSGTLTISGKGKIKYDVRMPADKKLFDKFNKMAPKAKSIVISHGITGYEGKVFWKCQNVTSVTIPGSVKTVKGTYCGSDLKLKKVTMKEGVKKVDEDVFSGCKNLKTINLPDSLETIGQMAFYHTGISELSLPKGVESIGSAAFGKCLNLKYVDLSKCKAAVYDSAFRECTSLVTFNFGKKVYYLDSRIFGFCDQKINICFGGNAPRFQKDTFSNNEIVALYPKNNKTWTASKKNSYEDCYSIVTWKSYNPNVFGRPSVTMSNIESTGKNKVSWDMVPGAEKYEVYRATKKDGKYSKLVTTKLLHFVNSSGTAEKKYYYKVRAIKENGKKSSFSSAKLKSVDLPRPAKPTITPDSIDGKPVLKWKALAGAEEYAVYRCNTETWEYDWIGTTSKTSYKDVDAKVYSGLQYKIQAISGDNPNSDSALSLVAEGKCICAKPQIEIKKNESIGSPELYWSPIESAVQYKVFRAEAENGTYVLLDATNETAYIDQSAEFGKTYWYKVIARRVKSSSTKLDSKDSNVVSMLVTPMESEIPDEE